MKKRLLAACGCAVSLAYASDTAPGWYAKYKQLDATYLIYAGEPEAHCTEKERPQDGYRCHRRLRKGGFRIALP